MEAFIVEYGYLALFVGTLFEGEAALIIGGFLARCGYMDLWTVMAVAFGGTLVGDQLFYHLGRVKGYRAIEDRPRWKMQAARVFALLHNHHILVILGFRFLYGLRGITPFVIGASGLGPLRFLVFNVLGALLWAVTIGTLGYLFGRAMENHVAEMKAHTHQVVGIIMLLALSTGAVYWFRQVWLRRRRSRRPPSPDWNGPG